VKRSTAVRLILILTLLLPAGAPVWAQQAPPPAVGAASGGQGPKDPPVQNGGPASALGLGDPTASGSGGPIEIDADEGIEWLRDQNVYIARGNAQARRGDMSITADTLMAHYRADATGKTKIHMVEADGHVVLVSKDSKIVGDKMTYDLEKGAAIITGQDLRATSKEQYVTANESLEYWSNQGAVVARGDAVAHNPQQEIHADLLTGYFRDDQPKGGKKLYQVEASGNVRILSKGNIARASKAVYNLDNEVATLEGGVKITRDKNQLNGERAVYNLKTGQAKITGGGKRVKTLLVPGSDSGGILKP
jgi:lipopolysaccharide export system protein LptA